MSRIKQTNGSVIIAALILTMVLGTLVAAYLSTVVQEEELAYRSRMAFQAVNIAEAGIDYAVYSFITEDWSEWETGTNGYFRTTFPEIINPPAPEGIEGFSGRGTNENYSVKVYAQKGNPYSNDPDELPAVLAEGRVTLNNGITVSRQIMVRLKNGTSDDPTDGGYWGNGILAKRNLTFNGQAQAVDSFNSNNNLGMSSVDAIYDAQALAAGITILGHNFAGSKGTVASLSVDAGDISLGNAAVYGGVATGSDEVNTESQELVGPNGAIYSDETELEGDDSFDGSIDADYLSYDFFADLPDVPLPEAGDSYQDSYSSNTLVGSEVEGVYTEYRLSSLMLSGDEILTVTGNVKLVVDGDVKTSGSGQIVMAEDAKLDLYVSGNITLTGGGLINEGSPPNLRLFNTGYNTDIKISGNGSFSGAIYAPNSEVTLDGGGDTGEFYGAIVADTVSLNGGYSFHYDEALSAAPDDEDPDDDTFVPEVHSWIELVYAGEIRNMNTILSEGI